MKPSEGFLPEKIGEVIGGAIK